MKAHVTTTIRVLVAPERRAWVAAGYDSYQRDRKRNAGQPRARLKCNLRSTNLLHVTCCIMWEAQKSAWTCGVIDIFSVRCLLHQMKYL